MAAIADAEGAGKDEVAREPEVAGSGTLSLVLVAGAAGTLAALAALPSIGASLTGAEPKAYWHLSRSSGLVAYVLLWLSTALGVSISNKLARVWPGGPTAYDVHQHASYLSLVFILGHALILLGDRYVGYTLAQLVVPFAGATYRPAWVGLGQVALYLAALVVLTSHLRLRIGNRLWRAIHFLSFAVFVLSLAHGLMAGSDAGTWWGAALYWLSGGSVLFLTVYRVLTRVAGPAAGGEAGGRRMSGQAARPEAR